MVRHERERVLRRVVRAVDAAARNFAREAAQLENGGGREAAAERLVDKSLSGLARTGTNTGTPLESKRHWARD